MKYLNTTVLSSWFLATSLFAKTVCTFGSISNDLNEISCGGYQVEFHANELTPFVTKSKTQELLTAQAGSEIEFEIYLRKELDNFDIKSIKELKIFHKDGADINVLQERFSKSEKTWGILLNAKFIVPVSSDSILEIFAEMTDGNGRTFWFNNNDATRNYRFLVLQSNQRKFILETPLEKPIFEAADSESLASQFSFEYDPQRATDLGVEPLWYKAGETRNSQIYIDYINSLEQTILTLVAYTAQVSGDSRITLNNLPVPKNASSAILRVYTSNYTKGRDCGKNTSDFFGCDDNFGYGHRISF